MAYPRLKQMMTPALLFSSSMNLHSGVIVDAVHEVAVYNEEDIESVTSITNDRSYDYIVGIAKREGRLVTLINIKNSYRIYLSKNKPGRWGGKWETVSILVHLAAFIWMY